MEDSKDVGPVNKVTRGGRPENIKSAEWTTLSCRVLAGHPSVFKKERRAEKQTTRLFLFGTRKESVEICVNLRALP